VAKDNDEKDDIMKIEKGNSRNERGNGKGEKRVSFKDLKIRHFSVSNLDFQHPPIAPKFKSINSFLCGCSIYCPGFTVIY